MRARALRPERRRERPQAPLGGAHEILEVVVGEVGGGDEHRARVLAQRADRDAVGRDVDQLQRRAVGAGLEGDALGVRFEAFDSRRVSHVGGRVSW